MLSKQIKTAIIATAAIFMSALPVNAEECSTQYGGSTTCTPTDLTINKQVQDPVTGFYVENVTTPKFSQGGKVIFKLIVKNTSGQTFKNVKITDGVPENLLIDDADMTYVNNEGKKEYTISSDKKSIEFKVREMPADTTVEAYVWTHLVGEYPKDSSFCRDNWANVTADERSGDKDFARFCVTNNIQGATTIPVTGVNDLVMALPFIVTGLGGAALLKKKNK